MVNRILNKMKIGKIILAAVTSVLIAVGCSKKEDSHTVVGEWHLVDIGPVTKSEDPYGITVYLSFVKDGSFSLYQQLQDGGYRHFSGFWELQDNTLFGYYADGTPWGGGSYDVSFSSSSITLAARNGSGEITTYEKMKIPAEVKNNAE